MRAAVYDRGCVEGIKVVTTRALPPNSKSALLVRVKACGVNPVDAKGVIGDKLPPALRSFARRVVDGKGAVTFLVRVKEALEDPRRLLMDL